MRSRSPHAATVIAAALILGGFVLVGLGWRGGAATLFVPTQIAYGVSGGLIGLALIGTGLGVLLVQTSRLSTARRSRELQHLVRDTVEVFAAVRERTANGSRRLRIPLPAPGGGPPDVLASRNGHAIPGHGQHAAWEPDVLLVPGAKTFHAVGCRIVTEQQRPLRLTTEEAQAAGLRACRICGGS